MFGLLGEQKPFAGCFPSVQQLLLAGYKDENRSAPDYDNSVDLLSPTAQASLQAVLAGGLGCVCEAHMMKVCRDARDVAELLVKSEPQPYASMYTSMSAKHTALCLLLPFPSNF